MKKKEGKKFNISLFITLVFVFGLGMLMGMIVQQAIFQSTLIKFGQALSGSNFEVNIDFNETRMVDRIHENLGLGSINFSENVSSQESTLKTGSKE